MLIGSEGLAALRRSSVVVFGIGGVGSHAAEALARTGVGRLILVDDDRISLSNINRQIHATTRTIGRPKVEVMRERILEIDPTIEVEAFQELFRAEVADRFLQSGLDYAIDAIDTIACKLELAVRARAAGIPLISSMGAGDKLDPTRLEVADIYSTSMCPLARVMRKELRRLGIERLKVVYSREEPIRPYKVVPDMAGEELRPGKTAVMGSVSFVPPVAGLIIAAEVVRDILERC